MIITRTPFRISFAGGGSDISSFYSKHDGCVLSTAINKYMYISVHPSFNRQNTVLKYSKTETVNNLSDIEHQYFKQVLSNLGITGVELVSTADIPSGTGLGSSSSFTVGLLHTLYCYKGKYVSKERLASEACDVEIEQLGNPIGKQDQYAAAYGGLNFIQFRRDGGVIIEPVIMNTHSLRELEGNLMMFYTGQLHSASAILREQKQNITAGEKEKNQLKMCELARELRNELQDNNIDAMGDILHQNWILKKTLASGISNSAIDEAYDKAINAGATGGKLLGAGGGGFLLFYVPLDKQKAVKEAIGLPQMPMAFDSQGSTVIYVGDKPDFI